VGAVVIIQQGGDLRVSNEDDVAAVTAITAVWATEWLELLASNRHTAVPAVASAKVNNNIVDECRHGRPPS
jgi:putative intracellular protease/amidase